MGKIEISIPAGDAKAAEAASVFFRMLSNSDGEEKPMPLPGEIRKKETAPLPSKTEVPDPPSKTEVPDPPSKTEKIQYDQYPVIKDGAELDRDGIPWNPNIHSSNHKIRVKDGRWTPKRGVDKKLYENTVANLQIAMSRGQSVETDDDELPPPLAPKEEIPADFPEFMSWVVKQDAKYKVVAELNKIAGVVGLDSIAMLAVQPNKIPTLVEHILNG
jgi:hypothetical protein